MIVTGSVQGAQFTVDSLFGLVCLAVGVAILSGLRWVPLHIDFWPTDFRVTTKSASFVLPYSNVVRCTATRKRRSRTMIGVEFHLARGERGLPRKVAFRLGGAITSTDSRSPHVWAEFVAFLKQTFPSLR